MKPLSELTLIRILPLLFLGACSPSVTAGSRMPAPIDVSSRPTFEWDHEATVVAGDPRLEGNPFFEEQLHESVAWQLALRGIRPVAEGSPTFLAHHHLMFDEHVFIEEILDEAGERQTENYPYERASITVHMIDRTTGTTVWVGWAEANVEPALESPEAMREWVDLVVTALFEDWPALGRPGG